MRISGNRTRRLYQLLLVVSTSMATYAWVPVAPRTVSSLSLKMIHDDSVPSLKDCICLVTGASRGIGKGIALELGKQGAIVYVTGTTTTNRDSKENAPGSIEATAEEIDALGGKGIPVLCDHGNDEDIKRLVSLIEKDYGRLDILVNNAFRLPPGGAEFLNKKFWEQGPEMWDPIHTVGLRSHYITSFYAMPLLFQSKKAKPNNLPRPLIVMISSFGGITYTFGVAYGVGKAGVDRLAKDMAIELRSEDVCCVSLWPGVVNTERTQRLVANGDWDKFVKVPLDNSETPQFTGKAVVAIAKDSTNMRKTGTYQVVAELAEEYNFNDINGKRPPSIRSLRFLLPSYAFDEKMRNIFPVHLIPDWKLPFWVMASGKPPDTK